MFVVSKKLMGEHRNNALAMGLQAKQIAANRKESGELLKANQLFGHLAAQHTNVPGFEVNAGQKPFDLYREFDNQIVQQFRLDEGSEILNRLMPLSRSVDIGRMVLENARSSDMGGFQTSLSGELGTKYDNPDYDIDGFLIPFHDNGFKRNWREHRQLGLESFQDVMIGQAEAAREHQKGLVSYMLDGTDLSFKGRTWDGFRNDGRVEQVDLATDSRVTFDFTNVSSTGEEIRKAFKALIDIARLENKITANITWFVSNEILSNFENYYGLNGANDTLKTDGSLKALTGVADIIGTSALTDNQILGIPMFSQFVQPIVALPVNTRMMTRVDPLRDPYCWNIESAIGIKVVNDFEDANKGAIYASS